MGSVNKVILIGNLGGDPESRQTNSGKAVTNFSLATNETWKDQQGNKQEKCEWHRIVCFGPQAEVAAKYLSKGKQVYIEGKLTTNKWTDKDGNDRYQAQVVCRELTFLGRKDDSGGGGGGYGRPEGDGYSGGQNSQGNAGQHTDRGYGAPAPNQRPAQGAGSPERPPGTEGDPGYAKDDDIPF